MNAVLEKDVEFHYSLYEMSPFFSPPFAMHYHIIAHTADECMAKHNSCTRNLSRAIVGTRFGVCPSSCSRWLQASHTYITIGVLGSGRAHTICSIGCCCIFYQKRFRGRKSILHNDRVGARDALRCKMLHTCSGGIKLRFVARCK